MRKKKKKKRKKKESLVSQRNIDLVEVLKILGQY